MTALRFVLAALFPAALFLAGAGCAHYPINPTLRPLAYDSTEAELVAAGLPLEHFLRPDNPGYRFTQVGTTPTNTDSIFVVVSISGGGLRAASFGFGALRALDRIVLPDGRTLLDEVDVISSASGGSFASSYYGLFGKERFLADFRDDVLERNIQWTYVGHLLKPWNWPRLLSCNFSRSDIAERYLARAIFEHRSFADMPRRRPFILVNATDRSLGAQFTFVQDHFDRLCSDLDGVQVARAVVASNGFPGLFTPITIDNYTSDTCGYHTAPWVTNSLRCEPEDEGCDLDVNTPLHIRAQQWKSYEDERRRFLHLIDGGVADNIAMREVITGLNQLDASYLPLLRMINDREIRHFVAVIVDARSGRKTARDARSRPPSIISAVFAAALRPVSNYSVDTVELLARAQEDEAKAQGDVENAYFSCNELADQFCPEGSCEREDFLDQCYGSFGVDGPEPPPPAPAIYNIHVRVDADPDAARRARVFEVPTALTLPTEDIQVVIDEAELLIESSGEVRRLCEDFGATCPTPDDD